MVDIKPILDIDESVLKRLIVGYTTATIFQISTEAQPEYIHFELRLIDLEKPKIKCYMDLDEDTLRQYREIAALGHSFGAFMNEICIGIALTKIHAWNASLWVQELHIAPEYQRQGIGHLLMDTITTHARKHSLRCIVCETQTTNVAAIQFYHAMGFRLDGIDLSYYTNEDQERGEVAVFMKKRLVAEE